MKHPPRISGSLTPPPSLRGLQQRPVGFPNKKHLRRPVLGDPKDMRFSLVFIPENMYLVPLQQPIFVHGCLVKDVPAIFDVVIWNHPVETTIKKTWLFGVPGAYLKIKLTPRCSFSMQCDPSRHLSNPSAAHAPGALGLSKTASHFPHPKYSHEPATVRRILTLKKPT